MRSRLRKISHKNQISCEFPSSFVRFEDGEIGMIVSAFDIDGDETDDIENCAAVVVEVKSGFVAIERQFIERSNFKLS